MYAKLCPRHGQPTAEGEVQTGGGVVGVLGQSVAVAKLSTDWQKSSLAKVLRTFRCSLSRALMAAEGGAQAQWRSQKGA